MDNIFKKLNQHFKYKAEEENMIKFINSIKSSDDSMVLDVGCGYGRNMVLVKEKSIWAGKIVGVEVNQHIVDENRKNGFVCYNVDEFKNIDQKYDCIIFSHIIEHFTPNDLKEFLEFYLERLNNNGYVIIATPLMHDGFYMDFDHIKMYHPVGISMVFGWNNAQVQYYSNIKLRLQDLWFRKTPYKIYNKRGRYIEDKFTGIWDFVDFFYNIIYKCSFGLIGKTNGWMGLYKYQCTNLSISKLKSVLQNNQKEYAIFGIGTYGKTFYSLIKEHVKIECFIDNAKEKQNTYIDEVSVKPPEYLKDRQEKMIVIISSSDYAKEIFKQLEEMGFIYGENMFFYDEFLI